MRKLKLSKAFTLMESGPVVLVTTHDGHKDNIMTISWTMVVEFTPLFAIAPKMHAIGIRFATLTPQSHVSSHPGVKIRMLAAMNSQLAQGTERIGLSVLIGTSRNICAL